MLSLSKYKKVILVFFGLIFVFSSGIYLGCVLERGNIKDYLLGFKPIRQNDLRYVYINPLIGVDSAEATKVGLHRDLKHSIKDIASDFKKEGKLNDYAVYFRDLNSSIWFGLNENKEFFPASLLKITYALAVYKQAENEVGFLEKKLTYTNSIAKINQERVNSDASELVVWKSYPVRELVRMMVVDSDNGARDLLDASVNKKYFYEIFQLLGIKEPDSSRNFQISAKDYALFLRLLYSATFLNATNSEELLKMFTEINFPYALIKPIPSKIAVAHKWGVHNFLDDKGDIKEFEVHDCGIIYNYEHPYILCVMTKGEDSESLLDFISKISETVFTEVGLEK